MACFTNKCKACCTKVVMIVSVIMFLLGVLVAIFGSMQMGVVPDSIKTGEMAKAMKALPDMKSFGLGILICGVFIVLTGLLGCMTAKTKKACFACIFIICTMVLGLVCLIFSAITLGDLGKYKDKVCGAAGNVLKGQFNEVVNNKMCTNDCRCDPGPDDFNLNMWVKYKDLSHVPIFETKAG